MAFSWNEIKSDRAQGWTRGLIQKENCGTVIPSEALTWTGKDVCGVFTVETFAEGNTHFLWTVKKNGIIKEYRDTIYINRSVVNEFSLNLNQVELPKLT